jgi:hypothetical protein
MTSGFPFADTTIFFKLLTPMVNVVPNWLINSEMSMELSLHHYHGFRSPNCMTQNAFCCGLPFCNKAIPLAVKEQNSHVNCKQTLIDFLVIDAYRIILGSLIMF